PLVAGRTVCGPIVDGVAPALPGLGKEVWRYAGNDGRVAVLVELVEALVRPMVGAIAVNEDRHVAPELDASLRRIRPERAPLVFEHVLEELVVLRFVGERGARVGRGATGLAEPRRPFPPRLSADLAKRVKHGVLAKPRAGGFEPGEVAVAINCHEAGECLAEFRLFVRSNRSGHALMRVQLAAIANIAFIEQTTLGQPFERDERWVAGKGAAGRVWRIRWPGR